MCPPDPQRAHHRQMQRIHVTPCLPGSSWPLVPCSWLPCSAIPLAWCSCCPVDFPGYDSGLTQRVRTTFSCGPLSDPHVRSCRGASACRHGWWCWRGDRDVLLHCSRTPECFSAASSHVGSSVCPPAAASGSSHGVAWVLACGKAKASGTGGRLHPGLAGERQLNQRPDRWSAFGMDASRMWALQAS